MTTDVFSPEKRSAVMRRVKGRDTGPEMVVRRALIAEGWRVLTLWECEMKDPAALDARLRAFLGV